MPVCLLAGAAEERWLPVRTIGKGKGKSTKGKDLPTIQSSVSAWRQRDRLGTNAHNTGTTANLSVCCGQQDIGGYRVMLHTVLEAGSQVRVADKMGSPFICMLFDVLSMTALHLNDPCRLISSK